MSSRGYLLGIDQGTSGSRALVLDRAGQVRGYGYRPLASLYLQPNQVEQDPDVVAATVVEAIAEALQRAECRPADIAACGIACQRDTDFVWDARTARPLANAITWQDLRTLPLEEELLTWSRVNECRTRLGYWPGPYSAALHLKWRLRHDPALIDAARGGYLRIGLSAAWLLAAVGQPAEHAMDHSLVQGMCLYDFRARRYWDEWLDWLGVPAAALPAGRPTVHNFGTLQIDSTPIPVLAMIGDQQGALLGYDCRQPGDAECTHGTASFVNVCSGSAAPDLSTAKVYLAWMLEDAPTYCLEADTTVTGAGVRWLRESLHILEQDDDLERLARTVPDAGGVTFVPAFTGLNVPYNDRQARASLLGLTLGHTRAHVARAFLDSIGYQMRAILESIDAEAGVHVPRLSVGGGLSASDLACQIQADLTGRPLMRPAFTQTTARAAALLAGIGVGAWSGLADLPALPADRRVFEPQWTAERRDAGYAEWRRAIACVRQWGKA